MSIDHVALGAEITADPVSMGYAAHVTSGSDQAIADLLNSLTSPGAASIDVESVDPILAQAEVVAGDYVALGAAAQRAWGAILAAASFGNGIPVKNTKIRQQIQSIWSGTTTLTNLAGLQSRTGSRLEVLFGDGIRATATDVAIALGRT